MDHQRFPCIFDTNVLLAEVRRVMRGQSSVYGQIMDEQPHGVFVTTKVASEMDRKIVESDMFVVNEQTAAMAIWHDVVGPKLRVVDIISLDIRSERVEVVVNKDRDDWPSGALVDVLAPALLHTYNVKDLGAVMGPEAASADPNDVAIAAKGVARFAKTVETTAIGASVSLAAAAEGVRSARRVVSRDWLILLTVVGVVVIVAYRKPIAKAARHVVREVGPKVAEALERQTVDLGAIEGTVTPPTLELTPSDHLVRAVATAGTLDFSRSPQGLSDRLRQDGVALTSAEVLHEATLDRWLSIEDGLIYFGVPFAKWRDEQVVVSDNNKTG